METTIQQLLKVLQVPLLVECEGLSEFDRPPIKKNPPASREERPFYQFSVVFGNIDKAFRNLHRDVILILDNLMKSLMSNSSHFSSSEYRRLIDNCRFDCHGENQQKQEFINSKVKRWWVLPDIAIKEKPKELEAGTC